MQSIFFTLSMMDKLTRRTTFHQSSALYIYDPQWLGLVENLLTLSLINLNWLTHIKKKFKEN